MMGAAQRDRKLVADPTPQGARLHEAQVMWVRGAAPADEAGLPSNELEMRAIPVAARLTQRERAFVDMPRNGIVHPLLPLRNCGSRLNHSRNRRQRRGRHLPARPSFAASSTQRSGSLAPTNVSLWCALLNAGPECGQ
jgi:hypothetical protein